MREAQTGKFGMAEAVVLLTMSSMASIFLAFPRALVETGMQAAWLSTLFGLVLALFQVYILYTLLKPYPQKNIVDITAQSLGRVAGTAANILYALFFVLVAAIFTRTFSEALLISALPRTPISVVSTGYVAMGVLGAYIGLEAMARSARVTYPFVVGGIVLLLISLVPIWDYTRLFPLLGAGPYKVFVEGGLLAGGISEILLSAVFVQSFHMPGMFGKITARAMIIGFFYLTLLEVVLLMSVTFISAQEFTLPFYSLSRLIHVGRYFQRVEAIFIIIWVYLGAIKVVLTLYAAAVIFAQTFKLPDHRPLIWSLALIIFTVSLLPPDLPTVVIFESVYTRDLAWLPTVVLPLIVLAADRFRNRRKANEGG